MKPSAASPVELTIEKLVPGGMGLARLEGRVVFVPGAMPGDRIRGRIEGDHRHHLMVRCEAILSAGPNTVDPGCPADGTCGGCQLRRLSGPDQDAIKAGFVREGLERIARLDPAQALQPLIPAQERDGYRRRTTFQTRWSDAGPQLGFFAHGSHDIVDLVHCPVLDPRLSALMPRLRQLMPQLSCRHSLTGIELVAGDDGIGVVFCLLRPCPQTDKETMRRFAQEIGSEQVWIRIGKASPVPLVAHATLRYAVDGFSIAFGPADFVQGHATQNHALVDAAMTLAGHGKQAWDLFCGIGNFTLPLTRRFERVTGSDLLAGSLRRSGENARRHGLEERVILHKIDLFRTEDLARLPWNQPVDLALLDPPRNGAEALCRQLASKGPEKVVYISCDPATFARDAAILVEGGYTLEVVQPVDLFPQTRHVEITARFMRR
ncbi:MAG: 23S rRNA (uracil(1939)-C(5))-methyltransferase RlmD [Magnetococcales bacterium]|nr:23S rRNA (uracil(1939)-C(5))-methyltransferase RlmD [Magnetococcales bacterium]